MLLIKQRSTTLSRPEPRAVPLMQSGIATSPLDQVTFILVQYKYFEYLN
jgi:hypothetical protein